MLKRHFDKRYSRPRPAAWAVLAIAAVASLVVDMGSAGAVVLESRLPHRQRVATRAERRTEGFIRSEGSSSVAGRGPVQRFSIAVETGLIVDRSGFTSKVQKVLFDRRGWRRAGIAFRRVERNADFRIVLASPRTTDELCAPLDTNGRYSCRNGFNVVINVWRWRRGARSYGHDLDRYRTYLINHEVGHSLGHHHDICSQSGARAPLMLPQTEGLRGCRPNPWPLGFEL